MSFQIVPDSNIPDYTLLDLCQETETASCVSVEYPEQIEVKQTEIKSGLKRRNMRWTELLSVPVKEDWLCGNASALNTAVRAASFA